MRKPIGCSRKADDPMGAGCAWRRKKVDNVIIVGLSAKNQLTCKKALHYVSNQGRMLSNIVAGVNKALEINKRNKYVLIVSSDIPPSSLKWWIGSLQPCMETKDDLYYGVCRVM